MKAAQHVDKNLLRGSSAPKDPAGSPEALQAYTLRLQAALPCCISLEGTKGVPRNGGHK